MDDALTGALTTGRVTLNLLLAFVLAHSQYYAVALVLLLICIVLDYVTGVAKGYITKTLSSSTGLRGLVKKGCYLLAVAAGFALDLLVILVGQHLSADLQVPAVFGMTVTLLLTSNELLSIYENLSAVGIHIPTPIKRILELINGLGKKGEETDDREPE